MGQAAATRVGFGGASRGFSLPFEVDDQQAVATYEGGVLKLSLPTKQEPRAAR